MQILIITGPNSRVREIHLTAVHWAIGASLLFLILFSASWAIHSVTSDARDALFSMEKKEFFNKRMVANSADDYESKLMELQARLEDAQRNIDQLDALRTQLLRSNGQLNLGNVDLGMSQGGPLKPSNGIIHLGNEDEQFGVRLDRTLQDSIVLGSRLDQVQKSLTQTWDAASTIPTASPLPLAMQPSSGLGYRQDPFTHQLAWHEGTDFPAAYGTPILATADGVVIRAAWDEEYGNVVDIQHKNLVVTRYAHAQQLLVKQGDIVKKSQTIAKVGSTGRSTGPHLHYEVLRDGQGLSKG